MPTVTLNPTKDTLLMEYSPTTNFGSSQLFTTGVSANKKNRAVLEFDGTTISGKGIDSAILSLYGYYVITGAETHTIECFKMTQPTWVEAQATWNIYKTSNNWTTAGGDYVTTAPAGSTSAAPPIGGGWITFDISAIVQDAADLAINILLLIKDNNETTDATGINYRSKEYVADATKIPKLEITYGTIANKTLSDTVSSVTETISKETTTYPYQVSNNNQAYVLNLKTKAWSFIDNAPYSNVIYRPEQTTMIAARRDTGNICTLDASTSAYTVTWTVRTGFYSFSQLDEMKEMPDDASQALKRLRKMYADVKSTGNITLTVFTEQNSTGKSFTITPTTTDYVVYNRVRTTLSRDIRGKFISFQFSGTCRAWVGDTSVTLGGRALY